MRRWEQRLRWVSSVLMATVAILILTLWGWIPVVLLLDWGPLAVLRIFGRAILGCFLAIIALTSPAWLLATATYPERRQRRLARKVQLALRTRRDWYTRWGQWANGLFRVLHPALHQQAQVLLLLEPTITRESLQLYLRDVTRASYREYAFWGGVLLCLGLAVLGEYRLPPHNVPGAQMALAAAIALSFVVSTCVLALCLRWLAIRSWRKVASAQA